MRPAAVALLRAFGSLALKLLLMHAYAALFMLLAQGNCRDAFYAELEAALTSHGMRQCYLRHHPRRTAALTADHSSTRSGKPRGDSALPIDMLAYWKHGGGGGGGGGAQLMTTTPPVVPECVRRQPRGRGRAGGRERRRVR